MFGPLSQVFTSNNDMCPSLVRWNVPQNFVTKNSSGAAQILFSSLKILAMLGATSVKSITGIGNAILFFNGDS